MTRPLWRCLPRALWVASASSPNVGIFLAAHTPNVGRFSAMGRSKPGRNKRQPAETRRGVRTGTRPSGVRVSAVHQYEGREAPRLSRTSGGTIKALPPMAGRRPRPAARVGIGSVARPAPCHERSAQRFQRRTLRCSRPATRHTVRRAMRSLPRAPAAERWSLLTTAHPMPHKPDAPAKENFSLRWRVRLVWHWMRSPQ
jgi:hypothetical protein